MGQYTPIYAAGIDGVLLDECGDVVSGAASYFAITNTAAGTDAFIRARLSPDYFTPSDIVLENGKGRRVVNRKGEPQLQGFSLRLEIAGLMPAIEAALLGDRVLKTHSVATQPTGVIAGTRQTTPGWALRMWEDVDNDICDGSGIPSIVHWVAAARNWQRSGDYTLESGARVTVFEAYAAKNASFADGPFEDAGPTAWDADEMYGYDLVFDAVLPTDTQGELVAWPIV